MFAKLTGILSTATFRQTSLTSFSSVINAALGAAFYFVLARVLGNSTYGQLSLIISSIAVITSIAGLGTDQSLVRFASKNFHYAKVVLVIKLISASVLLPIILLFFPNWLGLLVGVGVIVQLLFSFSTSLSQALQKYIHWSILLVGTNLFRLALLALSAGNITLFSASIIYLVCPLLGFVVFAVAYQFKFIFTPLKKQYFKDIFSFNKWVTAFIVVNAIGSKLDIFLTARFTNLASTGVYSLATQLVAILPQLTTAIGAVTSPKFASFNKSQANYLYLKKSLLFTLGVAVLASITLVAFAWIVIWFTGNDYSSAWLPFIVLLLGMDIFLITTPLRDSILYYFSKPQFFFWSGLVQAAVSISLAQILIPAYGLLGSSLTVLISQAVLAVLSINHYIYLKNKHV